LPSASSYYPYCGHRYSYRGLSPHQFMPMPGVHKKEASLKWRGLPEDLEYSPPLVASGNILEMF
jgi:hypothetical protein